MTALPRIIEHGSRIQVGPSPGDGSTFRFTLPVRVERRAEPTRATARAFERRAQGNLA